MALSGAALLRAAPASWLPAPDVAGTPVSGYQLNTQRRNEVVHFWNCVWLAPRAVMGWTGHFNTLSAPGSPGTVSAAWNADVQRRVNFYRALAGLPADITFDALAPLALPGYQGGSTAVPAGTLRSTCCQHAAFMNAVELNANFGYEVTHLATGTEWAFSQAGSNGWRHGNLAAGANGPAAVDLYILEPADTGDGSAPSLVGHRRWILYTKANDMANGDTPRSTMDGYEVPASNCLYVVSTPRANPPVQFVPWPGAGFFPAPLRPRYWSLCYPGASFATATVSVTGPSGNVPVVIGARLADGTGDNGISFEMPSLPSTFTADTSYTVTVSGITGAGVPATHTWTTTFMNPDRLLTSLTPAGPSVITQAGASFTVSEVDAAESREVQIIRTTAAAGTFSESAEDATAARIVDGTSGGYSLRQAFISEQIPNQNPVTFSPHSGTKAFHLTHPEIDSTESFQIAADVIPSPGSTLSFQECFRWLFTENRLSLEISADGGVDWTEIYGRNGAYTYVDDPEHLYNTSLWDKQGASLAPAWKARSVSLAAWAGKLVRLRFVLRSNQRGFTGTDTRFGCFVDSLSLTNCQEIAAASTMSIPAGTTVAKILPGSMPGGTAVEGVPYLLRARAVLGCRAMGYGPAVTATGSSAAGFAGWSAGHFPGMAGGATGDADGDGLKNLMEYAFGLNPLSPDRAALPVPSRSGSLLSVSFTAPPEVTGITYSAEYSCDLTSWTTITSPGPGPVHSFSVSTAGQPCLYLRIKVSSP